MTNKTHIKIFTNITTEKNQIASSVAKITAFSKLYYKKDKSKYREYYKNNIQSRPNRSLFETMG